MIKGVSTRAGGGVVAMGEGGGGKWKGSGVGGGGGADFGSGILNKAEAISFRESRFR